MRAALALLAWLGAAAPDALAQPAEVTGMPDEPAFVEHRLTLQLSDPGDAKQALIISTANNVLKFYGPDKLSVHVVAFGPGIELLRDGNPNAEKIRSLAAQGVQFDACMNTIDTIERTTGQPFALNPVAHRVTAGIAQIMTLAEHGYITVRP